MEYSEIIFKYVRSGPINQTQTKECENFLKDCYEFNEDIENCLIREIKEETNLSVNNLNILKPLNLKFNAVSVFVLLYSAEISCDSPIIISYEHSEYNFFSKSEIKNLNMPQDYKNLIEDLI